MGVEIAEAALERFGPYNLIRCIAIGGMGELFLAQREGIAGFSKQVVVKRIRDPYATNPDFVAMFLNEGRVAAVLDHPNIVHIHELDEVDGQYFLAMEYVPGKNLAAIREKLQGPLPLPLALYTVGQLCEALSFAHHATDAGGRALELVHRDVSPPNVLVSYAGAVKLTDFGIAKVLQSQQTAAGILKGKLAYLSPEQARGERLDKRSDIFALGLVLFEATTGHRAVPGDADTEILYAVANRQLRSPSQFVHDYPQELERIYLRATAKDRSQRYQDAKEMQEDLLAFQMGQRMIVTAAKMGLFMQSEFRADAKAEGEALYDTVTDEPREPSMPTVRAGPARAHADPEPGSLPKTVPEVVVDPLVPASTIPEVVVDAVPSSPVSAPREPELPPAPGRRYQGAEHPTLLALPAMPARDQALVATVAEHPPLSAGPRAALPAPAGGPRIGRPLTGPSPMPGGPPPVQLPPQGWRPVVIALTALVTLLLGFGGFVLLAPEQAPPWLRDLRGRLGLSDDAPSRRRLPAAVADLGPSRPPDAGPSTSPSPAPAAVTSAPLGVGVDGGAEGDGTAAAPPAGADAASAATARGTLEIESRPRLLVVVDGRHVGLTPVTVPVAPGARVVRLSSPRHRIALKRRVTVEAGRRARLDITVGRGRLVVRVRPWAHVFVDGAKRGTTPMRPIWLYEGRHTVRLVSVDGASPHRATVAITAGRTTTLVHRFE